MDKKTVTLEKLIARYDAKAQAAYDNYQATGIQRYERERINAEDLAEALRAALYAVDEHAGLSALGSLRGEMVWLASRADALLDQPEPPPEKMAALLEDLICYAVTICRYQRRERRQPDDADQEH